jgi:hypothetical protein
MNDRVARAGLAVRGAHQFVDVSRLLRDHGSVSPGRCSRVLLF